MRDQSGSDDRVIVIGSGPCGAIAAARLVDRGLFVTMLDAGTGVPRGLVVKAAGNTVFRAVSRTQLLDDRLAAGGETVAWYSSLSLGGLSNYWTAAVPRFAPSDFTDGARIDDRFDWPVRYDDLVTHYEYAERFLDVTGGPSPIPGVPANVLGHVHRPPRRWHDVIARANEAGHSLGVLPMAKGQPWMVAWRGTEFQSYRCIVQPLLDEGRTIELRRGARAIRLRTAPGSDLVEGVDYVDVATGEMKYIRGRAVVVAAGSVDSTVLLLRSRSPDFPAGLGNRSGVIGRYLHDHPREWWTAQLGRPLPALAQPVYAARRPIDEAEPLLATSLTVGLCSRRGRLKSFVGGAEAAVGVQVFGTVVPSPEIGISLDGSAVEDRADIRPRISLRYDADALANLVAGRDRMRSVFADAGIAATIPGPFHDVRPGESVHFGGTVRMHRSPEFGALDARGRLHDVPNVAVGDASCFTTGPEKNPTLTAMALSSRAADLLADDLLRGALR